MSWTRNFEVIIALLCVLASAVGFAAAADENQNTPLTPTTYLQLKADFYQITADGWQAKINTLNQDHDDAQHFEALEEALTIQEATVLDSLLPSYNTTAKDFFRFAATHSMEIAEYLEENPELQTQLTDFETTIQNLLDEYEALLANYGIRGEGN